MGQTQLQGTGGMPPYQYGSPEDDRLARRGRRPIWPWIAALVALIVIAAIVFAYKTINSHNPPAGVTVPTVVGDKLVTAEAKLLNDGFKVKPVAKVSTSGIANTVSSTTPAGGTLSKKGKTVTVYYYTRPGAKALPSVRGLTPTEAFALLHRDGWTNVMTNQSPVASLRIPNGDVVNSTPPAGTKVSPSSLITINVSGGGKRVPVVTDYQVGDAEAAVRAQGLVPYVTKQQGPPGATPGSVWETKPGANTVVLPGTTVTLYVVPGSSSPSTTPSSSSPSSTSSSPSTTPSSSSPSPGKHNGRIPVPVP